MAVETAGSAVKGLVTFYGKEPRSYAVSGAPGARMEWTAPEGTTEVEIVNDGDVWLFAGKESLCETRNGMPVAPHSPGIRITGFRGTLVILAGTTPEGSASP
jgi:hypothetical protein